MSQKSEKYARTLEGRVREVERRMDAVSRRQINSDGYVDSLRDVARHYDALLTDINTRHRREVTAARNDAARWKARAVLYIIAVTMIGAFCVWAMMGPAEAAEDGSLPGDDTPAIVRCALTDEEAESAENEMIEAALLARGTRLDDVTVTHYDCCVECCGKDDGITASGVRATPGVTVAVDPDVIPLGSDVLVDYGDGEIHYMRADDVGSSIKGHHIDVCVKDHETAINEGIKTATVYWISPEAIE